nr:hypothetical protein [Tanacetum cinerariifolium]GEW43505.1 hypothetical protein [Tanacetum cinerariifolium]
ITDIRSVLTQRALTIFCETYHNPDEVYSQLPSPNQTIHEMPSGKIDDWVVPLLLCKLQKQGVDVLHKDVPKDPFPKSSEFNANHYATLVALPAPFHKYPKSFLCLVGISRYYTLDEDAYPEFLGDNDEGMDLLAFIQTADPTKVRVAERQRAKDEPRVLESTVGRLVPLLPIASARASSELEASVDRLFDEGASGMDKMRQKKKKTVVTDAGGPSHRPKKLREDFGALGGVSTAGKSMAAVQSLFSRAVLEAEARAEPVPTLPFVTSSVFIISSDSSHTSGANIAEAEVDSIIRSSAPAIATVTTVTSAINTEAAATRAHVAPSLFGVGSSSTGRSDSVPGRFSDDSGSDFLIGGIRTVVDPDSDLQKVYVPRWSVTNGFGLDDSRICREMLDEFSPPRFFASVRGMDHDQLFTEFNVGAARHISLNAEVRMHAEYNIREKRKLRAVVDEQAELLKAKDGEIESLKAQLMLKEAEAAEAIRLRAEVFKFESVEQSLRGEVGFLRDQNTALKREKNELNVKVTDLSASVKVHELELSSVGLQEKVAAHEGFVSQLDKFQDEKLEEAVEKGMQEGLSAGITHGAEGRQLANVATYNPSAEADYLSALQHLQSVNFSLIAELKSNKDASVDTIMNLLCLDDVLAKRLGLTESQPHFDQLMVPIHHSLDHRVVGASALTFSLEVSNSRVKKMRENIANHVSALRGVFVSLSEPLSVTALEESQGGVRVDDETTTNDDMNLFVTNDDLNISE